MENAVIAALRVEYAQRQLRRGDLKAEPLEQLAQWLSEAVDSQIKDANAMSLATVGADGQPSSRMVLLKGISGGGILFFTNYGSRKARQMEGNGRVAANLFWPELERQICVEGRVEKLGREEAESYFQSRPRSSQLGAWASRQSETVPGRDDLEEKLRDKAVAYDGGEIPVPPFWGGYRLTPVSVEFWQGRRSRLHDRLRYRRGAGAFWEIERLSP